MTYCSYSVMVTENCKKIEPVVVKLYSKTNIPLFSEHGVLLVQSDELKTSPFNNHLSVPGNK